MEEEIMQAEFQAESIKEEKQLKLLEEKEKEMEGSMLRNKKGQFIKIHGDKNTKLYRVWCSMKERCNNIHNKSYKNYGKKGIKVCSEWNNYINFKKWALSNGYQENLTIDRINFNKNYEPNNCRWVDTKIQNRNYSKNIFIEFNNKKMCLKELSEKIPEKYATLLWRYKNNKQKFIKGVEKYGRIRCI